MTDVKKRVLILCAGNSCRSQMAEAFWSSLSNGVWEAHSAGSRPAGFVHPLAIAAMHELGLDISHHESKPIDRFIDQRFDLVITVCNDARQSCPTLPGAAETLHWPFDDPADASGDEASVLAVFRCVRDEISQRIRAYLRDHHSAP